MHDVQTVGVQGVDVEADTAPRQLHAPSRRGTAAIEIPARVDDGQAGLRSAPVVLAEHLQAAGKRLDMGKSCVRFRKLEDVPLDVLGETIASVPVPRFLELNALARAKRRR